jgi:hypothetical protein
MAVTHHCRGCGEQVSESCPEHPKATVDSIVSSDDEPVATGAVNIVWHGIDHEQYFPGCGVALTKYDAAVTGCGNDWREALEDALECAVQEGWHDAELHTQGQEPPEGKRDDIDAHLESLGHTIDCDDDCEHWESGESLHYYVTLQLKKSTKHVTQGSGNRDQLFRVGFGAYDDTEVYVWSSSADDAFQEACDYAAAKGRWGVFTSLSDDDLAAAAEELDLADEWNEHLAEGNMQEIADQVIQHAEVDLTIIGHTTYNPPAETGLTGPLYVASHEWTVREADVAELTEE